MVPYYESSWSRIRLAVVESPGDLKVKYYRRSGRRDILHEILSWPVGAAKACGFWPYSRIQHDGKLGFRPCSLGAALSYIVFLSTIVASTMKLYVREDKNASADLSPTEAIGQDVERVTQALTILFLTTYMLLDHASITGIWNRTSELVNNIWALTYSSSACRHSLLCRTIRRPKPLVAFIIVAAVVQNSLEIWSNILHLIQEKELTLWETCANGIGYATWDFVTDNHNFLLLAFAALISTLTLSFQLLRLELEYWLSDSDVKAGSCAQLKAIKMSLEMAQELEVLAEHINEKLRMPLVALLVSMITSQTLLMFFGVEHLGRSDIDWESTFNSFFFFVVYTIVLHVFCSAGTSFTQEAKRYGASVGKVEYLWQVPQELRAKAAKLSMKFELNPPAIAPGGYYTVNNGLMASILAALTSYLVVLVQFNRSHP